MTVMTETVTVTAEGAARYAGASSGEAIAHELEGALELVRGHVGTATVPAAVLRAAVLDVASDLYHRRQHHNGIVTFDGPEGTTPFRVNRDPMASAYPVLRPYVSPPIA